MKTNQTKSRYMGGPVDFAEAPNGAIVNAKAVDAYPRVWYTEPMAKEVVDGVWLVGGAFHRQHRGHRAR